MFSSWKDYFTFNKKERNGILILCFVLFLLLIFYQFTHLFVSETTTDFSEFEKAISDLDYLEEKEIASKEAALFYFDPNTLDDKGWLTLGLSEGKLQVLRNYQKSGGYFKNNEDLQRCYAFGDAFYNSIKDYVQIPKLDQPKDLEIAKDVKKQLVELNQADSLELLEIKGIGPFYAKQIIKYRNELGGFHSYNQFSEIWGLDNLDIDNLKKQSRIDTLYISQKNINIISIDELSRHPYLNYKEAKMIVNYRQQHGNFKDVKDIQEIKPISPEIFRKIAPYLKTHD